MRLEMGLCWCEVLIKSLLAKRVQRKLAPFGVGIAFTGSISALLFQSRYVDAAPCCTKANAVTSISLSEASEESKNSVKNIQSLNETGGLEQDSSRIPNPPFENGYSPRRLGHGSAEGQPLIYPSVSPPEYEYQNAFSTKTLSALSFAGIFPLQSSVARLRPASSFGATTFSLTRAIASDVRPIKNGQRSSASLVVLDDLQALEQDSLSYLSQRVEQSPATPAPLTPNLNQPAQPLPTPRLEIPDSTSPIQPSPTPRLEIPDSTSPTQPSPTPRLEIPDSTSPTQPSSTPTPQPSPTPAPSQPSPTPTPTTAPNVQTIQVQKIKVTRSTVFSPDQLNSIVQPYEGRTLTLEQLREVADKITQLYLDGGYITSRAILVDQTFTDGVVEIAVVEGSLEDIKVEGTRRVKPGYIRSRVQLGAGKPLNTGKLEDQLRLLRADPLFENVEASLRAGSGVGQSILIVRVVEANPFEGSVGIDNYSPPSVGSERLGLNLLYRNLTGHGDEIAASYYHTTTSGADSFDFSYRIPLNPMNGTLQLRAAPSSNKITQESSRFLGIRGQSDLYEISFRQPLIRSPKEEFALSLGFTYQEGQTFIFNDVPFAFGIGPDVNGVSSTRVIKFGQDYLRRDARGAWSLRSLFSFGIGELGATINPHPTPDGRFVSWLGQVQRVQILNENNFLIVGADIQLTPNSLLPSQQFVIGGGQSLRGYRQNIRSGDNGVRFSVEDRITLQRNESGAAIFQLAPFFDTGIVWNQSDNPNNQFLPSQRFLAGIGMGLIWEAQPGLSLRLDYGYPLIDLDDRGTNAQDEGFYFSVRYQF